MSKALVLLSGGQDSTTCLYWAKQKHDEVTALCIAYGQRHAVELDAARKVAELAGVCLEVLQLGTILKGTSPLVSGNTLGKYDEVEHLPGGIEPTFVPGRNALFLVLAVNRALVLGFDHVVTGVCEEDYGGYPDCRRSFIDSMEHAMSLATEQHVVIETPLMHLTKAESVHLAVTLPGCVEAMAHSHTCYDGAVPPCGKCHACHLRARGFQQAGVPDPLIERLSVTP